jgi:ribonuclease R
VHFTSPIRRYADLLVHRALIKALHLGPDGIADDQVANFAEIGEQITETERRAQQAERDAIDRYLAAFMAARIGGRFAARISGVTRFGLFVTVTETGATGMVPFASLREDYWRHDERGQTLTGRRTQKVYRLAQEVEVLLSEANPMTGSLVFDMLDGGSDDPTVFDDGRQASASSRASPSGKRPVGKRPAGKRPPRR